MQRVLESAYLTITYTKHLKLLNVDYHTNTENLTEEEWKRLMLSILENIRKFEPAFLLSDNREMRFIISIDLQTWFAKEIYKFINEKPISLEKFALVLPYDLIAELSVQQTVDEYRSLQVKMPYEQKIFTAVLDAEKWIFNN
jgi:hypothetical protein